MSDKSSLLGTITKIVFIGGAIILFALLVIWVVRWIPKAVNGVANIGSSITNGIRGGESINVFANENEINTKEPFVLSFDYSPTVAGEYYFSYSCEDSLIIDIQSVNGPKRIICNTPFRLGENLNQISLLPNVTKQNIFIDTNLKVSYKSYEDNEEVAFGTESVTIKNTAESSTASNPYSADFAGSSVTSSPTTETSTNIQTTNTTRTTGYYGNPDLAITNIANTQGYSALSFTAYNYGTRPTGVWYFSYTDAENPNYTQISPAQPSLNPGQGLFVQVNFDGQRYDNQLINIYLDSTNSIYESNESNNRSSVVISGYRSGYSNNYYYYNDRYYNYNDDDEADLFIVTMEVGRMIGGRFDEDTSIDENDEAAVRFVVRNKGGEVAEDWRFEITNTPYDRDDDYRSGRQNDLYPGEQEEFIVRFDNIDEGSYNIKVEVDSDDDVDEERENNNTETERLRVTD